MLKLTSKKKEISSLMVNISASGYSMRVKVYAEDNDVSAC
jgi:hypothetical protein